jgi:glycosyltransferase involved in cell wall biosynthesis
MKLLIITQKVDKNDSVLGFFHRWIEEFSKYCEEVNVVCLYKGEFSLPQNVKIWSLGKEEGISRIEYLFRFYSFIWRLRKEYDSVFVHMNQVYVILGGLLWRLWKKKISLWYVHRQVSPSLKIAEKMVQVIFTTAPESFGIVSKKILYTGHGIPIDLFGKAADTIPIFSDLKQLKIAVIGRITPIKDLMTLLRAVVILKKQNIPLKVTIIGSPVVKSDEGYFEELKKYVQDQSLEKYVTWQGNIVYKKIPYELAAHHMLVNLCPTGGLDKVVLEAMAAGRVVLVTNRSFADYVGKFKEKLLADYGNSEDVAVKINLLWTERIFLHNYGEYLQAQVMVKSNLSLLVKKIIHHLS